MLVDKAVIHVKAGKGGNGCESFYKPTPLKAIPTGGSGGRGGDIIFKADSNVCDIQYFKFNKHIKGNHGQHGNSSNKTGRCGKAIVLSVPIGTKITNVSNGCLIRDLKLEGEEVIIARGGKAGYGNADHKVRTMGSDGEEFEVALDFQISSDIVLIGEPSSGKSSLLATLTRAKVKIADYPFSTLAPQLGSYEYDDYKRVTICDLPSLIQGSYEGKGIGNYFLKHAIRSKVVFFVLAPMSQFSKNLAESFENLRNELSAFDSVLDDKDIFILINKSDLGFSEDNLKDKDILNNTYNNVYTISVKNEEGLKSVMTAVYKVIYKD